MKAWQDRCGECGEILPMHRTYCLAGHIEAEALRRFRLVVLRWALVGAGVWLIIGVVAWLLLR